jgi:hypothetical protein
MAHERRLDEREHDEHVHGNVGREAGGAHFLGEPHAPVDLHGARVAALHLGKELRRLLLLDERDADAFLSERHRQREPGRARPDHENLRVAHL